MVTVCVFIWRWVSSSCHIVLTKIILKLEICSSAQIIKSILPPQRRKSTHPLRVFFFSFCSSSLLFLLGADFSLMSSSLPASCGSSSSFFTLLSVITSPLSLLALLSFNFPSRRFMSFLSGIGLFRMPLEPRAVAPLRALTPLSSALSSSSSSSSSSRSGSHQKMTSHKDVSG